MNATLRTTVGLVTAVLVAGGAVLAAADLEKALAGADGRRRAAENGLRQIKAKPPGEIEQIRALYTEAASRNNAWLDIVCQAVQQPSSTAPDVTAAVEPAASTLVAWVSARNRALGVAGLTPAVADAVRTSVVAELTEIAGATWKRNHGGSAPRRANAVAGLNGRLRWKAWDEVQ